MELGLGCRSTDQRHWHSDNDNINSNNNNSNININKKVLQSTTEEGCFAPPAMPHAVCAHHWAGDDHEVRPIASKKAEQALTNALIYENLLSYVGDVADLASLSRVNSTFYRLTRDKYPLHATVLSIAYRPYVADRDLFRFLYEPLEKDALGRSSNRPRYRLMDDGKVIKLDGGVGKPYNGAWRFLRIVDLSHSSVHTRTVMLLIAASSRGAIPGLTPSEKLANYRNSWRFEHEFSALQDSPMPWRLLMDQGLQLERVSAKHCRNVNVGDLILFLRKALACATDRARTTRFAETLEMIGPNTSPQWAEHRVYQPETVEDLREFGLPCFTVRALELANSRGLEVDSDLFRGSEAWGGKWDVPYEIEKTAARLNLVCGALGVDVDVAFCLGAGCAADVPAFWTPPSKRQQSSSSRPGLALAPAEPVIMDPAHPDYNVNLAFIEMEREKRLSKQRKHVAAWKPEVMPQTKDEKIFVTPDGRTFRFAKDYSLAMTLPRPTAALQQQQQQQQQQGVAFIPQVPPNAPLTTQAIMNGLANQNQAVMGNGFNNTGGAAVGGMPAVPQQLALISPPITPGQNGQGASAPPAAQGAATADDNDDESLMLFVPQQQAQQAQQQQQQQQQAAAQANANANNPPNGGNDELTRLAYMHHSPSLTWFGTIHLQPGQFSREAAAENARPDRTAAALERLSVILENTLDNPLVQIGAMDPLILSNDDEDGQDLLSMLNGMQADAAGEAPNNGTAEDGIWGNLQQPPMPQGSAAAAAASGNAEDRRVRPRTMSAGNGSASAQLPPYTSSHIGSSNSTASMPDFGYPSAGPSGSSSSSAAAASFGSSARPSANGPSSPSGRKRRTRNADAANDCASTLTPLPANPQSPTRRTLVPRPRTPRISSFNGEPLPPFGQVFNPPHEPCPRTTVPPPPPPPPPRYSSAREVFPLALEDGARSTGPFRREGGRRIAMTGGPRGVCRGCEREVELCRECNGYWIVYCVWCMRGE